MVGGTYLRPWIGADNLSVVTIGAARGSKRLMKVDEDLGKAIFQQWFWAELGKPLAIYEFGPKLIRL
jgi:hypothetical protein